MKSTKTKKVIVGILIFLMGGLCGVGGLKLYQGNNPLPGGSVSMPRSEYKTLKSLESRYVKAERLIQTIKKYYYKDVDEKDINEGIYKGIFAGLGDKYSGYMTAKEYEMYETAVTGKFEGIGVNITENKKNEIEAINVIPGAPAEKAGIKKGDIIKKVDGKVYEDIDSAARAMRGKKGTKVKVTVARKGKTLDFTVTRDKIVNKTVNSKMLKNNIGYIQITAFEEETGDDFINAVKDMEKKKVKGLVIDLRDNGGGLVNSGVTVADELLGKGVVTYTKDKYGKKEYYKSESGKTKLPYVLLVNGNTASASEILSAAVKDSGEGKIIGIKTYGKGVIQVSQPLGDGSGIKLTVMQYFSPKGHTIHKKGVTPDYVIKNKDGQLNKAIELLK